jgi:competence protein ComEA
MVFGGSAYAQEKQSGDANAAKVNINTAGKEQLMDLPRIGEKIAERIIEYREKNGKFKRPEDIMKVKGIGEKTFKKFEKRIVI